jgi:prepilin-type N-terminal cleavage/methylation domain-containing protein
MGRGTGGQRGFTLIEVLVSTAIFSVVALAVYSAFAGGVGAWRRAQEFSAAYQTTRLVLEDMARELKNAVTISGTDFVGESRSVSFLTVLHEADGPGRPADPRITRVTYEMQRDRATATYALSRRWESEVEGAPPGETELVANPISNLEFQYTSKDEQGRIGPWRDGWRVSEAVPLGVKITLVVGDTRFTKLVFIPHGFQEPTTRP